MNNFQFWQSRGKDTRFPYLLLLLITVAALALGLYHYFTGPDTLISWITVPQLQTVDAYLDQFPLAQQIFSIKANGYVLSERYDTGLPLVNLKAAYLLAALTGIGVVFYLSAASTLKKIPFLVFMTLLIFFLVNTNLAGLNETSSIRKYLDVLLMALFILPAYAFQAFFPSVSFSLRLLAFTALTGLAAIIIGQFSTYPAAVTVLHVTNHAVPALVTAAFLFMVWVSYEIIHVLVWFNTQAKNPARRFGLWQFMLIALLYFLNLLLLYLEDAGVYHFGLVYLNAFIILFLSSAAGFWGLRKREEIYGQYLNFWPGAAFLYLVFAVLSFGVIGYAFATANDSLIAALNSFIIYTHLAYGFVFFLYVMINFGRLLSQKLQIYKVIYDPKKLPYYPVYMLGTLGLAGMMYYTNLFSYKQVKAGYYNLLGDLYKTSGEMLVATRYYQESDIFEHSNVKANFSLAAISREKNFRSTEIVYLKEALKRRPDPKIYARLASLFDEQPYFFEQQYTLKEGLSKFPESPMLLNNMALLYSKTTLADSTLYYFNQAGSRSPQNEVVQSNMLAFFIKNALPEEATEVAKANEKSAYAPLRSNAVLLQHLLGKETAKPSLPPANAVLTPSGFTLLYHSILNRLQAGDTSAISYLNTYAKTPGNDAYSEDLALLKGALQQYNGQPLNARATLENLSRTSSEGTGYYQDILGQWFLSQEQYRLAASYFGKARSNNYPDAPLHEAWALALDGQKNVALGALQPLLNGENKEQGKEARKLAGILAADLGTAFSLPDAEKVPFIKVQPLAANLEFNTLAASVKDPELKMAAENAILARFLAQKDLNGFGQYLNTLGNASNPERSRLLARYWVKTNNAGMLKQNLANLKPERQFHGETTFYRAFIALAEKQPAEAKKLLDTSVKALPYYEDALLTSARFYRDVKKDDLKAYEILITGITYNPTSASLFQAYVLQSLRAGFENYALAGMLELQALLSEEEYATFKQLYDTELAKRQKAAEGWE